MARMLHENKVVDLELPDNDQVVGFLLDNGQSVKVKYESYLEYSPIVKSVGGEVNGPPIYVCRPADDIDRVMVGFVRNIIATYYHSPWTPE